MLRDRYKVARGFDYEHIPEILLFVGWLVGWLACRYILSFNTKFEQFICFCPYGK